MIESTRDLKFGNDKMMSWRPCLYEVDKYSLEKRTRLSFLIKRFRMTWNHKKHSGTRIRSCFFSYRGRFFPTSVQLRLCNKECWSQGASSKPRISRKTEQLIVSSHFSSSLGNMAGALLYVDHSSWKTEVALLFIFLSDSFYTILYLGTLRNGARFACFGVAFEKAGMSVRLSLCL